MIELEFRVDNAVFEEDAEGASPATIDPVALLITAFEFPVRFAVNGVEMLATHLQKADQPLAGNDWVTVPRKDDARYSSLPLLGFAVGLYHLVTFRRPDSNTGDWLHLGSLRVRIDRDESVALEGQGGRRASTTLVELKHAATVFLVRVRAAFVSGLPGIELHAKWQEWFPKELDAMGKQLLS